MTEEVDTSGRVGTRGKGGRVKKERANQKKKARTKTWSDVVKGLQTDEELEIADLVEWFYSDELKQVMAKQTRGQLKSTLTGGANGSRSANVTTTRELRRA